MLEKKFKTHGYALTSYFMKEWWADEENKERMRKVGRKLYREGKMGLWRPNKGIPHPMLGKHHTEEARGKMSEAKMGVSFSIQHRKNLSNAMKKRWRRGDFEGWNWRKIRSGMGK